jgi:uncharacterized protein (DUF2267 family)
MSTEGLEVIDTTVQKTMLWLKEVSDELYWDDRHASYLALRGCLHHLRDMFTVEEVAHFGAQLPMLIRGIYYEGWDPSRNPRIERTEAAAETAMRSYLPESMSWDYQRIITGCLRVLVRELDPGLIRHVIEVMPKPMANLWQEALL